MDFVIERFMLFYKDLLILLISIPTLRLFFKYLSKSHFNQPDMNTKEYFNKNFKKVFILLGIPLVYIAAPVIEELIFRMPLIFFFPTFDIYAKISSVIVALVFGLVHYKGFKVTKEERDAVDEPDFQKAQQLAFEALPKHVQIIRKLQHVFNTAILGYIAAYYGIVKQSIWVSVGIHAVWNILFPLLMPLIALLLLLCVDFLSVYLLRPILRFGLNTYFDIWSKTHGGRSHLYETFYGAKPKWIRWLDTY